MIFGGFSFGASSLGGGAFQVTLLVSSAPPVVVPALPLGGDDVPREEYWEKRKPGVIRDATLDNVIKQAYDKAMGRLPAVALVEVVIVQFDYEADDEEVLMLMMG